MKISSLAAQIAGSVNRLYERLPESQHDAVDYARDEMANALAIEGHCTTSAFNDAARERKSR